MRRNAEPLSLFVVHWNRPKDCAATVRAFLSQGVPLKVTVIDNCSDSEACETLSAETASLAEVLRLPENKGWGPAINVALRKWLESASDSYCLISAHDASPSPDCVAMLVNAMDSDSRIGIACPQYPDESVPHFSSIHGVQIDHGKALARGALQSIDVPHGTLMIVRRECLNEIGIFDERYFAYGDEHELGARAVRRRWKVVMVWGALVTNPGTTTPSAWRSYLFGRNSLLLVHDYFGSMAATMRAFLLLANTVRLSFARNPEIAFSAKARFRAVGDYFRGRFGPPRFR